MASAFFKFLSAMGSPEWLIGLFCVWILLILLVFGAMAHERDAARLKWLTDRVHRPYLRMTQAVLAGLPRMILPPVVPANPRQRQRWWHQPPWRFTPHAKDPEDLETLRNNPWSWPVMDFAMKLAIAYPLFFAFAQWTFGQGATGIGDVVLFPDDLAGIWRYAIFGLLALYFSLRILASATSRRVFEDAAMWLFLILKRFEKSLNRWDSHRA